MTFKFHHICVVLIYNPDKQHCNACRWQDHDNAIFLSRQVIKMRSLTDSPKTLLPNQTEMFVKLYGFASVVLVLLPCQFQR